MMKKFIIILTLCTTFLYANGLKIAVGLSIPPYVIKEHNSGFIIELINDVLALQDLTVDDYIYASNIRMSKLLESRQVDAAINIPKNNPLIYYSDPIAYFYNAAISLKSRDITVNSINDLYDKRVLAFQNANKLMGRTFAQYANKNPLYYETIHQKSQVKNLVLKRIDITIADKYIFQYYFKKLYSEYDMENKFNYFHIFGKTPRYMGFLDKNVRDKFNVSLKQYKKSQKYQKLLIKYGFKGE